LNSTLGTGEFEPVFGMDPTNPNRSFGACRTTAHSFIRLVELERVGLGGDGNGNAINPQNPNIVFSTNDSAVHRSTRVVRPAPGCK